LLETGLISFPPELNLETYVEAGNAAYVEAGNAAKEVWKGLIKNLAIHLEQLTKLERTTLLNQTLADLENPEYHFSVKMYVNMTKKTDVLATWYLGADPNRHMWLKARFSKGNVHRTMTEYCIQQRDVRVSDIFKDYECVLERHSVKLTF